MVDDGPVDDVANRYMQSDSGTMAERRWPTADLAPENETVRLIGVRARSRSGLTTEMPDIRDDVGLEVEYEVRREAVLSPNFQVYDGQGVLAFIVNDSYSPEWGDRPRAPGLWKSTCWIPGNLLGESKYVVGVSFGRMDQGIEHLNERNTISFQVVENAGGRLRSRHLPWRTTWA